MRRVDRVLHLRRGVGEYVGIGICRRAGHIAGMAEEIRGAPEQLDAGLAHLFREIFGDLREVAGEFTQVRAFGNDIAVMEREKGRAEQREHLERDIRLQPRRRHSLGEPGPLEGRRAEHVGPGPGEIVPVADGRTQMVRHRLAEHDARCVVMTIGERIFAGRPFILDRRDVAEKSRPHLFLPSIPRGICPPGAGAVNRTGGPQPPDPRKSAIERSASLARGRVRRRGRRMPSRPSNSRC